jgi:hypothetical protein
MHRFRSEHQEFGQRFERAQIGVLLCLAFVIGCSDKVGAPVNVNLAQKILALAMDNWENGVSSKVLLDRSPSVFVQEAEWNEETQLLDYEIISDDQSAGPNLIATVKLKLSTADGNVTEKTATYIVGTSPALTVYRNLMK